MGRDAGGVGVARIGTTETVRNWVRQAEVDAGTRPGTTTEESAELKRLKRENAAYLRSTVWRGLFRLAWPVGIKASAIKTLKPRVAPTRQSASMTTKLSAFFADFVCGHRLFIGNDHDSTVIGRSSAEPVGRQNCYCTRQNRRIRAAPGHANGNPWVPGSSSGGGTTQTPM